MIVQTQNILIDRDMMTKIPKQIWSWEFPVLDAKFGGGRIVNQGAVDHEIEQLPDAETEWDRMMRCHGFDDGRGGTNRSYVELAYGAGKSGLDALRDAISESAGNKSVKKQKAKSKAKVSAERDQETDSDKTDGDPLGISD